MSKRKHSPDLSSPRPSIYDNDPTRYGKRRRPLFCPKQEKPIQYWALSKEGIMSPLLEYIVQNEEAFRLEHRIASLYADFGQQPEINPEGYQANVAAWTRALCNASYAGVLPLQSSEHDYCHIRASDELAIALEHPQHGKPACLPAVFHTAAQNREMIPLKHFTTAKESIYKTTWLPSPWKVLTWSLRQVGIIGPDQLRKLGSDKFVIVKIVAMVADKILEEMREESSTAGRVLSRADFQKRFSKLLDAGKALTACDVNTLLVYLARDRQAISYNEQTVKFKPEHEAVPLPITREDTAIATLRDTLVKVNAQILRLMEKAADAEAAAREAVSDKKMVRAKAALRTKKQVEMALNHRTEIAHKLDTVFTDLQQAADQVEIVEAMRIGAAALKDLNEQVGGSEGVQGVVDAVNEHMSTTEEISNLMSEGGQSVDDEMDIEDELAALEQAETDKHEQAAAKQTAKRLSKLDAAEKRRSEKEAAEKRRSEKEAEEKKRRMVWQAARPRRQRRQEYEEMLGQDMEEASTSLSHLSVDNDDLEVDESENKKRRPMHA